MVLDVLENTELTNLMPNPWAVKCLDAMYAKVDKGWLFGEFYPYFVSVLDAAGITGWEADFDCDKYAKLFHALAGCSHHAAGSEAEGCAVGLFCYQQDKGGGHAINVAVTESGLTFIEPQTGQEKRLSSAELQSSFLVLF